MKNNLTDFSTIAAIATPPGNGGVGIIRISGPESLSILRNIFAATSLEITKTGIFESHRMYHGRIFDPSCREVIDEVLAVYMKAPRSFTAENVVEIQGHGGSYVLGRILSIVIDQGARIAEPGEFTMRAFLNGRIDLTQAEGVLDLIEASSDQALKLAASQIGGGIRDKIKDLRDRLRNVHAGLEALIDFPDETEDAMELSASADEVEKNIVPEMKAFLKTYEETRFLRDGVKLVIAGPPNAGKSSLMNALTGEERSIVTSIPGTTRDLVRERLSLAGTPVLVTDTAGLRESEDEVESIGISLTRKALSEADAVLWVMDITKGIDEKMSETIRSFPVKHGILVWNKADLAGIKQHDSTGFDNMPGIMVSAKTGNGLEFLKQTMIELLLSDSSAEKSGIALNLRHKNLLESAISHANRSIEAIRFSGSVELAAEDLRESVGALDAILGENMKADILDDIFSRFCIGK
ncbi:tRNA uridine-5-carboxymethylaminomethyl(34) synthesis GTPase MnmE [Desulforegula conservatrix]|uniref:tRNA uridine-5-carboxymethylaminomethyl(34) synthesis GTPase MnmE n=1 Tax=Desulforegula conservatrix TaxID=153026 RepID=UPI0004806E82|nr:tRNA uridine-5-carboxymethylaminomethyl(34) synthesis GTPase MnmE [Desulforegula conservatrix]